MIKVLMVVKAIETTGVTSVMMSYYDNIDRSKFKVDFATGSRYEKVCRDKLNSKGDKFWVIPNRDKNIIAYVKNLAKIISREKYDIIHVHGNSTMIFPEMIAAKLGGAKVRIAHSHNTKCNHPKLEPLFRPIFEAFYTNGIACGEQAGKWMFKDKPFTIINNGIDTNRFVFDARKRVEAREKINVKDELVIGHIGYFNYQKNHEKIINIFKEVNRLNPSTKLLLVGDGEERNRIEEIVNRNGLSGSVIFYGLSDEIEVLLSGMDIFILPSHFEGLPVVLIEAQANGLTCVVSSAVSRESNVTMTEKFISLEESDYKWAEIILKEANKISTIEKRMECSKRNIELICNNKYDIVSSVKELEQYYQDEFKKKEGK